MPMTIVNVELTKFDSDITRSGRTDDIAFDVEFTGVYDPREAAQIAQVTTTANQTFDLAIGAPIDQPDSGVFVKTRRPRFGQIATATSRGFFTILVTTGEGDAGQFTENPLQRRDSLTINRNSVQKPIPRDRNGRLIATYRQFEKSPGDDEPDLDSKPIELFSTPPTIRGCEFTAVITGYRDEYLVGQDDYDPDGPDNDNPLKQQDFTLVNDADVDLDGKVYPAGTLALISATASRQTINYYNVIAHQWTVAMAPTHNLRVLNAGTQQWDPSQRAGQELQPITGPMGVATAVPWPLNESGKALPNDYKLSDLRWLNFRTTKAYDFSKFGWRFPNNASGPITLG